MSKLKNNHGFTLIEVMVVIVIMSVLMAIAVPSVMKYLGTGDEAKALDQAYACVSAAEYYGVRTFTNNRDVNEIKPEAILKKAGVDGTLVNFTFNENDNTIIGLLYKSKANVTVTYKDNEYFVGKEVPWDINNLMAQLYYISREHDLSKYLTSSTPAKAAQELQRLYKEQNDNKYYPLSQKEKDLLVAQVISYDGPAVDSLIWKPVYASDNSIILCADNIDTTSSNVVTPMIYYKGNYYVHIFTTGDRKRVTSAYVNEYALLIKDNAPYEEKEFNEWVLAK